MNNILIKPSENNLVAFQWRKQKGCDKMCRCRMGNPKKMSRFICLKHCGENHVLDGLQRGGHQREKKHIKDAFCIECQDITKNLEVRYCDSFDEMMQKAKELHREYYI